MCDWPIPTALRYDFVNMVQLDVSWLPVWRPAERQDRPTITQIGHAHTMPAYDWVLHPTDDKPRRVPLVGQHVWCTKGWDFWTLHLTYERRESDDMPVLCRWPFEDLRAIHAGAMN